MQYEYGYILTNNIKLLDDLDLPLDFFAVVAVLNLYRCPLDYILEIYHEIAATEGNVCHDEKVFI